MLRSADGRGSWRGANSALQTPSRTSRRACSRCTGGSRRPSGGICLERTSQRVARGALRIWRAQSRPLATDSHGRNRTCRTRARHIVVHRDSATQSRSVREACKRSDSRVPYAYVGIYSRSRRRRNANALVEIGSAHRALYRCPANARRGAPRSTYSRVTNPRLVDAQTPAIRRQETKARSNSGTEH